MINDPIEALRAGAENQAEADRRMALIRAFCVGTPSSVERVIHIDPDSPPIQPQAWGFTCCGTAQGFETLCERDEAAKAHLGKHTMDYWRWEHRDQ